MTIKDIQNIMKSQKTSDNTYFSIPTHEINNAFKEISIALGELKKIEGITELKDLKKEMKKQKQKLIGILPQDIYQISLMMYKYQPHQFMKKSFLMELCLLT